LINNSSDELMIRHFAGAQREGIGRFTAEPMSGCWQWSDAVYEVFGYLPGSVLPSWDMIMSQIPEEDRALVQACYESAGKRPGPFSWSHRIRVHGATRSISVVGEALPIERPNGTGKTAMRAQAFRDDPGSQNLVLHGYVIDQTHLRTAAARAAATDAVQNSVRYRATIEQAKGALMLAYGLDADAAFALLKRHSQCSNRKLHAIAADVVDQVREDELSSRRLRLALDRILANGHKPDSRAGSIQVSTG
jgi:hypothetical protein